MNECLLRLQHKNTLIIGCQTNGISNNGHKPDYNLLENNSNFRVYSNQSNIRMQSLKSKDGFN